MIDRTSKLTYYETFKLQLFNKNKELIYQGELNFNFDPTKKGMYKQAITKFISELSKSNIIFK